MRLVNIANYKLLQLGRRLIKSITSVYDSARPGKIQYMQAKRHLGNWLFCFKKPTKAEHTFNENTAYQTSHVKSIKSPSLDFSSCSEYKGFMFD